MSDLPVVLPGAAAARIAALTKTPENGMDTHIARRQGLVTGFNADGTISVQIANSAITVPNCQVVRGLELIIGGSVWVDLKGSDPLVVSHSNTPLPSSGIEPWNEVSTGVGFTNLWVDYGSTFATCAYYKDPDGFVHFKGMMKTGTIGLTAFTLPVGYRPLENYSFAVDSNLAIGVVTVNTDGTVKCPTGNNTYVSLMGISFPTQADFALWTPGATQNGWGWYRPAAKTDPYPAFYRRDDGLVYAKGNLSGGTVNTDMIIIPDRMRPRYESVFASVANNALARIDATFAGVIHQFVGSNVWQILTGVTWWSMAGDAYPWALATYQNSWVTYAVTPEFYDLQYLKDKWGVVHVRGLISTGTVTAGTVITTLPAGYRPLADHVSLQVANGAYARLNIRSSGNIDIQVANATYTSVNFRFRAEQ